MESISPKEKTMERTSSFWSWSGWVNSLEVCWPLDFPSYLCTGKKMEKLQFPQCSFRGSAPSNTRWSMVRPTATIGMVNQTSSTLDRCLQMKSSAPAYSLVSSSWSRFPKNKSKSHRMASQEPWQSHYLYFVWSGLVGGLEHVTTRLLRWLWLLIQSCTWTILSTISLTTSRPTSSARFSEEFLLVSSTSFTRSGCYWRDAKRWNNLLTPISLTNSSRVWSRVNPILSMEHQIATLIRTRRTNEDKLMDARSLRNKMLNAMS